ncbi:MAG TPA: branched-chain amino acid ABC transporter substrate-binding protein [Acidimicrobiales bacterium]|nr:branched-chain amino acid ABC transporter substrate-binding protein [Acidimicrobiales bacterium]
MSVSTGRRWRLIAAVVAAGVLLAACGGDDNKSSNAGSGKKTVAIGFVGPLTGDNANLGINVRDGMRVAVEEANAASKDYTFVIKPFDTQGDPAQAPGQAAKYIPDAQILGIVGPTFSGETRAVLPDLEKAKLTMISASATNPGLPTVVNPETVFHRVIPDDDVQGLGVANYVAKGLKAKKVALIHDNSDYGKGLWESTLKGLAPLGVSTALTDAIDPKSTDYSAAVNKVKAAKPDLVFFGGYYSNAGLLKKQLSDAGVTAKFVSGDGALDPGFITASGAAGGEGAIITCPCKLATTDAGGALGSFATKYKSVIGKDPGTYSSEGYDAANIFIKGVEAGKTTRAKLLDYVETLSPYDGLSKKIEFEANGNVKGGSVFVYLVKSGKLVELGTTTDLAK